MARSTSSSEHAPRARAKLFANGRSQAVRLPKEFRMPGKEVVIHRDGDKIVLEPLTAAGWPADWRRRLDGIDRDSFATWRRPPDPVPTPIDDERDLP